MDKTTVYRGAYCGVDWEINYIEREGWEKRGIKPWWTYYIYIHKDRLSEKQFSLLDMPIKIAESSPSKRKYYEYSDLPDLGFHCGCTFYEKECYQLEYSGVKIGCDYNHYWDEGKNYDLQDILEDVKGTINKFLLQFNYKRWCCNCGKIVDFIEGHVLKQPDESAYNFTCNECFNKKENK